MKDREVDAILDRAAQAPHEVDPALLASIADSVGRSLAPVRPLPPAWALAGGLVLICAAAALALAAHLGLDGIHKLSAFDRALIFPVLAILVWLAATARVAEIIPGSRRRVAPGLLLPVVSLALLAVFSILFRDYRTDHFLQGIACLKAGLLDAVPAALASWLLLRRGFATNSVVSGLVAGTLAGLAGVTMLELHCPNFQALHILLWHTAVVPVSGAAGALLAWLRSSPTR
jgi:protein-S-isoprenylcysteine O-methyltransferase Ste14